MATTQTTAIVIENIETARLREGIDDVGLRVSIARLQAEDRVRLSMSGDGKLFETLSVRITSRRGGSFRGKLVSKPRTSGLKTLSEGAAVTFSTEQIHSIIACKDAVSAAPSECFSPAPGKFDEDDVVSSRFAKRSAPVETKTAPKKKAAAKQAAKRAVKAIRRLRVEADQARRFIRVPIGISHELHQYLRSRRVRSSPPQPYFSDVDCIELDRSIDVEGVQAMLDTWRHVD